MTKWTPNDLLKYDWLQELISWKARAVEGETRHWNLTQYGRLSIKCHLGWTINETTYKIDKRSRSPEHAVSLALEEFDGWQATKIRQEQANVNSQGEDQGQESSRQAK